MMKGLPGSERETFYQTSVRAARMQSVIAGPYPTRAATAKHFLHLYTLLTPQSTSLFRIMPIKLCKDTGTVESFL